MSNRDALFYDLSRISDDRLTVYLNTLNKHELITMLKTIINEDTIPEYMVKTKRDIISNIRSYAKTLRMFGPKYLDMCIKYNENKMKKS